MSTKHLIKLSKARITRRNIDDYIEYFKMPRAVKLSEVIVAIIEAAKQNDDEACLIRIARYLLAPSYSTVPAQFGKYLAQRTQAYSVIHAFRAVNSEYITVSAGDERTPTSFRAEAYNGIGENGYFEALAEKVPASYAMNPHQFSSILTRRFQKPVKYMAVIGGLMRWSFATITKED